MHLINDDAINRYVKEDVPYFDLTGQVLGIDGQHGTMRFICREQAVVCGVEEVLAIFQKLGVHATRYEPSGTMLAAGSVFLEAEGKAGSLHIAWKPSQNMLEYCSGIATRTNRMVVKARAINPKISILTTRKIFPGTKELAIKAVLAGGAYPHRLGLSESILIFKQHIEFLGGFEKLEHILADIKIKACEKKITVEVETPEQAFQLAEWGVDSIQFDKIPADRLHEVVTRLKQTHPHILLIAAGGVNENNVETYAASGVDAIVTTAAYFGKPVDIGVQMTAA